MIVTSAGGACRDSPLCFLYEARGGSGNINRRSEMVISMRWALTIGMAFLLTPQVEASHGPVPTKVDTKLGVVVEGSFELTCTCLVPTKKDIIVYRDASKQ